MGAWGAGLTQSDEYCEVYDSFMEKYDSGKSVEVITDEILNTYLSEFDADDGILHDVYFALAKAQWMCGLLTDTIMDKVKEIIQSGKNLEFLKELDADNQFLRERKKNLDRFLSSLETPRKTPRKRKTSPKARPLPPANIGDIFSYKDAAGLRIVIVLDRYFKKQFRESYFCCILDKEFQRKPVIAELDSEKVGLVGVYDSESFLPASKIRFIGSLGVPPNKYKELFGNSILLGCREDFFTSKRPKQLMTFRELLNAKNMSIFSFLF